MNKADSHSRNLMPWITTVLMVAGIACIAAYYWNQHLTVQKVKVNELFFTDEHQVILAADEAVGQKPDSLDLTALSAKISQLGYVKSVHPYVEPNGTLRFTITERKPLALLIDGNQRVYVDEDGVKIPILAGKTQNVPLLYGYKATPANDTLKSESFMQVRDFLLNAQKEEFGWATISELAFNETDGVVALSQENGVKLIFGRNDFKTKLENWEAFYAQVIRTKGINAIQQVDLRFKNQVVTREI